MPMVSSIPWFEMNDHDLMEVPKWCKKKHKEMTLQMMSRDLEKAVREKDPYLFPAEMPSDMIKKLPPFVIVSREFCNFRHDAEILAKRLEEHGKILEFIIKPGRSHYSMFDSVIDDYKKIFSHYI